MRKKDAEGSEDGGLPQNNSLYTVLINGRYLAIEMDIHLSESQPHHFWYP